MKIFTKILVLLGMLILVHVDLAACTYTITPTVIQPTCGKNGSISIATSPGISGSSTFKLYLDGSFLATLIGGSPGNFNSLAPGTYKVVVTDDASKCTDSVDNIVLYPATNTMQVTYTIDTPKCDTSKNGGKIELFFVNPKYPMTFQWSHSSIEKDSIADDIAPGTYKVSVTDNTNCTQVLNNIVVPSKEVPIVATDTMVINTSCDSPSGSINLILTGGYMDIIKFEWKNVTKDTYDMPLTNIKAGKYTCYVTDTLGCKLDSIKDIEVKSNPAPQAKIIGKDSICKNEGFTVLTAQVIKGDSTLLSYEWYYDTTEFVSTSKVLTNAQAGPYMLIVTDPEGCVDTQRRIIHNYPEREINLTADPERIVINQKSFITIDSPDGLWNFSWTPTETSRIGNDSNIWVFPSVSTYYTLRANYGDNCTAIARKYIEIVEAIDSLVIPDLFTPNGDGVNDMYKLRGNLTSNDGFEFRVYDRWGNNVYNAYSKDFEWDGNDMKGKTLNYGVYTYMLKYNVVYPEYKDIVKSGTILLER